MTVALLEPTAGTRGASIDEYVVRDALGSVLRIVIDATRDLIPGASGESIRIASR
jgi:hypothetical protein